MGRDVFHVDEEIRKAWSLPPEVYRDARYGTLQRDRVFARSWQLLPDSRSVDRPRRFRPTSLLPGCLDEPLLITRDADGRLHCLSNVCTHRAHLVAADPGCANGLRCRYHGRRFELDGRFRSMPEFEGVRDFPGPSDDLPALPVECWGPLAFTAVEPAFGFSPWVEPVRRRVDYLRLDDHVFDPETSRDYEIDANWALYCDNYLEGFHIPFVHEGLASVLDWSGYRTELHELGSLQVGTASDASCPVFDAPPGHVDHGARVAAYYFWLFPNLMLNFYPWGLSINLVEPLGVARTRVRFLSWVFDPSLRTSGAGAALDEVELEDQAVVKRVQVGVGSRLARRGRYSPTREAGVHHFHRLLARFLAGGRT